VPYLRKIVTPFFLEFLISDLFAMQAYLTALTLPHPFINLMIYDSPIITLAIFVETPLLDLSRVLGFSEMRLEFCSSLVLDCCVVTIYRSYTPPPYAT
jgi:hypothetical protein